MDNVIEHLEKRGFIDQVTSLELKDKVNNPLKVYIGFDPTADSLHLGNLVGIIALKWFQKFGHYPYAIIGGATGRIGDPSGKSIERPFLDNNILEHNVLSITEFLKSILKTENLRAPVILNNNDWFKEIGFIDFLRDVGKYFRVTSMLAKDCVKTRLESEEGLSFTEFAYQVLQSFDFHHLYQEYGVEVQMGGSDQWGNITAGIEFARKKDGSSLYGLTFPLITRSDGKKFGKSESGAIWLDEKKLSPYLFYQYLIGIPDADVIKLLRLLTFLELEEIQTIERGMQKSPNFAQRRLAEEVTEFVHGKDGLEIAQKVTQGISPGKEIQFNSQVLENIAKDLPNFELDLQEVVGKKYVDIANLVKLVSSKSEAGRLIVNGGAYLNNKKIEDSGYEIAKEDLIDNSFLIIGKGKKQKILIKIKK